MQWQKPDNSLHHFMQAAKQAGCTVVNGLEMFVGQAMQQFELFTGQPAPADLMYKVALDALCQKKS